MTAPARLSFLRVELRIGPSNGWVDVTEHVELGEAVLDIEAGFSDRFGDVRPMAWSFELSNNSEAAKGQFTPDNPASPYFGRFVEGAACRVLQGAPAGPTAGYGYTQYRYLYGEVRAILPTFPGDTDAFARVSVSCVDVMARLSRTKLRDMVTEQTLKDYAIAFWLLDDAQGSTGAAESSRFEQAAMTPGGNPAQISWGGGRGTAYDGASSLALNPDPALPPAWLDGTVVWQDSDAAPDGARAFIWEAWVSVTADQAAGLGSGHGVLVEFPNMGVQLDGAGGGLFNQSSAPLQIFIDSAGVLQLAGAGIGKNIADGAVHHIALVPAAPMFSRTWNLHIDGALAYSSSVPFLQNFLAGPNFRVGYTLSEPYFAAYGGSQPQAGWPGTVSRVALYDWGGQASPVPTLIRDRVLGHYAFASVMVESAPERIKRLMSYLGGEAVELYDDAGNPIDYMTTHSGALVGPQETAGQTLLAALQEAWRGEGGVMWSHRLEYKVAPFQTLWAPSGHRLTFAGRKSFRPIDVAFEVDASGDARGAPQMERTTDGRVSTVVSSSRALTVTVGDAALAGLIGAVSERVDTALADEEELLYFGQDRIAQTRNVRLRVTAVTVDPATATVALVVVGWPWSLWGPLLALVPGRRIRVTGLPAETLGYSERDAYVLSWAEAHDIEQPTVTLALAPADDPAEIVIDDDLYGRVSSDGDLVLAAGLTASATSMQVSFATVGLSVDPTDYPVDLEVQGERVTVSAAPAGSTSPQTVALSARGVGGTVARAHSSGELVDVWLQPGAAL